MILLKEEDREIKEQVEEIIASGICEPTRLYHMLSMIENGKPFYKSDLAYLKNMRNKLELKMEQLQKENKEISHTMQQSKPGIGIGRVVNSENLVEDEELNNLLHQRKRQEEQKNNHIKDCILPEEKKSIFRRIIE